MDRRGVRARELGRVQGSRGGPLTLELGYVSLKKVGSQDSRMKKEQAADSWEKMAALQGDRYRLRATAPAPKPHGGQRPWESQVCWLYGQSVPDTQGPTSRPCPIW